MKASMRFGILLLILQMAGRTGLCSETTFLAIDPCTDFVVASTGPSLDRRCSPCSTFKIALSVIGYNRGVLQDEQAPVWSYDGSPVPLESHKVAQSPQTWMDRSVVWYSRLLARKIGKASLQNYISRMLYGNQDVSGEIGKEDGFTTAHLMSTLKISPREQAVFLKNLVHGCLPVSARSMELTRKILYNRTFSGGWKLFGKTGTGVSRDKKETIAWHVGWLERGKQVYVFALLQEEPSSFPTSEERQETVKRLLLESGIEIR